MQVTRLNELKTEALGRYEIIKASCLEFKYNFRSLIFPVGAKDYSESKATNQLQLTPIGKLLLQQLRSMGQCEST